MKPTLLALLVTVGILALGAVVVAVIVGGAKKRMRRERVTRAVQERERKRAQR